MNDAALTDFKIMTDTGVTKTTLYMQAYSEGHSQADITKLVSLPNPGVKLNIYVCGGESISLTAAGNVAQFFYEPTPSPATKKITWDFRPWFQLDTTASHGQCGITKYWIGGCLPQFAEPIYASGNSKFYMREQNAIISKSGK